MPYEGFARRAVPQLDTQQSPGRTTRRPGAVYCGRRGLPAQAINTVTVVTISLDHEAKIGGTAGTGVSLSDVNAAP